MSLPVNYQDDVLDTTQNTTRIYDIKKRSDNSVVAQDVYLVDKTAYNQRGTSFGATDINNTNQAVNDMTQDITSMVVETSALPAVGVENRLYFCTF